eukprot:Skav207728  [mRNA]  locus=scaffold362:191706:193353:- [translate_table: standard]
MCFRASTLPGTSEKIPGSFESATGAGTAADSRWQMQLRRPYYGDSAEEEPLVNAEEEILRGVVPSRKMRRYRYYGNMGTIQGLQVAQVSALQAAQVLQVASAPALQAAQVLQVLQVPAQVAAQVLAQLQVAQVSAQVLLIDERCRKSGRVARPVKIKISDTSLSHA